jgi:hypothetical protein
MSHTAQASSPYLLRLGEGQAPIPNPMLLDSDQPVCSSFTFLNPGAPSCVAVERRITVSRRVGRGSLGMSNRLAMMLTPPGGYGPQSAKSG